MKPSDLFKDRILTISNLLSLLRIIAAPFIGYFMYREHKTGNDIYKYYELTGIIIIIISDFFDGFLARLLDQVSRLGQFLDPVADKISALSVGIFLMVYKGFPIELFIFALIREIIVVIFGVLLFSKKDIDVKPNIFGKICAALLALAAIVYTLSLSSSFFGFTIKQIVIFMIFLFYILGGILYFKTYSKYIFGKEVKS